MKWVKKKFGALFPSVNPSVILSPTNQKLPTRILPMEHFY
jgi:hypothetical protein